MTRWILATMAAAGLAAAVSESAKTITLRQWGNAAWPHLGNTMFP